MMNPNRTALLLPLLLLAGTAPAVAEDQPSYAKQVKPFLAKYCSECHSGDHPKAGLNLDTYKSIMATGDVVARLPGQLAQVTALAFSGDGRRLAVASGAPATAGEVRLYAVPAGGLPGPQPERVLQAHADLIYALAFRPDGQALATA